MEDISYNPGDIVLSVAGRDRGGLFVIVSCDGLYAYICDGDVHKIDKPKKKKIKHIRPANGNTQYIASKLEENLKVTNTELRRAISEFEETNI